MDKREVFDVIVVGGGNAGLVAALSAQEAGARVLIFDAAPREERGGNSRFADAVFRAPHGGLADVVPLLCKDALSEVEHVNLAPYTPDDYTKDLMTISGGKADPALVEKLVKEAFGTLSWMRDRGVQWETTLSYSNFAGMGKGGGKVDLPPGGPVKAKDSGVGLTENLWSAVENTDITIMYDCPAHDLIIEGNTAPTT